MGKVKPIVHECFTGKQNPTDVFTAVFLSNAAALTENVEVKNYSGTLSYTSQLRDFVSWSQTNGYQMHLYTNAHLTGPLQQVVDGGLILVFPLK